MKGIDKFLIGILVGVVVLLVVTFILVLTRPEQKYISEEKPDGVVHNYFLALKKGDYERALEYLSSDLKHAPKNVDDFIDDIDHYFFINLKKDTSITVKLKHESDTNAWVTVREIVFSSDGIFSSSQYETIFDMKLHLEENEWKLTDGDRYWRHCWSSTGQSGCN